MVNPQSKIRNLSPFLDSENVLRVGGRLPTNVLSGALFPKSSKSRRPVGGWSESRQISPQACNGATLIFNQSINQPLYTLSCDPGDFDALTPGHLLVGRPITAIAEPSLTEVSDNSCQVIYSQFGLAIHQNDHQARRRFVEWAQNEIAVVPNFQKRILFSDEAHFWLNGYVNKQNCRIWREANPQVYVETPLHPEKLTVWCALWAGGILLQKR
ncbi:hypothetical protein TNCV_3901861 [Trichonephila clavipes]|nr:hypothetical protein TNCV_3901861 [Trichonephila clavipes]